MSTTDMINKNYQLVDIKTNNILKLNSQVFVQLKSAHESHINIKCGILKDWAAPRDRRYMGKVYVKFEDNKHPFAFAPIAIGAKFVKENDNDH